jgi:hypothetical protein
VRGSVQHFEDSLKHAIRVLEDVVIPKPDDPKTTSRQIGVAVRIHRTFTVLAAVSFNHQPLLKCNKVDDPRTDRHLPAEFRSGQLP